MGKRLLAALFFVCLCALGLGFSACENWEEIQPIAHTHDFSRERVADEYLFTAATCTDKAVYYVTCACGEKSEETFAYGARLGHTGENCTRCGKYVALLGMDYQISEDYTHYTLTGVDGYYFAENIVIPALYNGLPVTEIAKNAFKENSYLKSVTMGENITHIGDYAFYECENLEAVVLNDGVETIGAFAFTRINLYDVDLPDSLQTLDNGAFWQCTQLTEITIPDSVVSIGKNAFRQCENLEKLTVGSSVETIGDEAFLWCRALRTIEYQGTVAQWSSITKEKDWNYSIAAKKVICSDGEVAL